MMILCLSDLELLAKFIQEVEKTHTQPDEKQVLSKLNIMYNKRKALEKQNNPEDKETSDSGWNVARSLTKGLATGLSSLLTDSNNR